MSDIAIITTLIYDKRSVADAVKEMAYNSKKRLVIVAILVAIMFVVIALILTLISKVLSDYVLIIMVKPVIATLLLLYNIKTTTAVFSRTSLTKFLYKTLGKMISLSMNIKNMMFSDDDINNIMKKEAKSEIELNLKQWSDLDKEMKPYSDYTIDEYWEKLGLDHDEIRSSTSCIRFEAKEPTHPKVDNDYCIDMREHLPANATIQNYSPEWVRASMSDQMHVKSIYKRLCPVKKRLDFRNILKQGEIMNAVVKKLSKVKTTHDEKIHKALATKGSAGQFAKGSAYEEMWKSSTSTYALDIWRQLSQDILTYVFILNYLDPRIVSFVLYRKMEAMTSDEKGVKPTRLMNAPNLVCRISDSITFTDFNDAMIKARGTIPSSLGINIFLEFKLIHVRNPHYIYITCDFKDYDGGQHPAQGFSAAYARVMYNIKHKVSPIETAYILPKYRQHMRRKVTSTSGISYDVIGQQASGDITTSDDNTLKTMGVCLMYIKEMINKKLIHTRKPVHTDDDILSSPDIFMDITSDDSGIMCRPSPDFDANEVNRIYEYVTNSVGWTVKQESFDIRLMGDDPLEYLSHGVRDRAFLSRYGQVMMIMRCLVRPKARMWGKFMISPEIENRLSTTNKSKLVSKYMTLCMVSLGHPNVMISSLMMLLLLRSSSSYHIGSYSWAGISATSIRSLMLNSCIELQLGNKLSMRFDWIALDKDEIDEFYELKKDFIELAKSLGRKDKRINIEGYEESVTIDNLWWNYRNTLQFVYRVYKSMDKHSLLSVTSSENKWWQNFEKEDSDTIYDNERPIIETGKTLYCDHLDNILEQRLFRSETNTKYNQLTLCEQCYTTRCEERYNGVYVCIVTMDRPKDYAHVCYENIQNDSMLYCEEIKKQILPKIQNLREIR